MWRCRLNKLPVLFIVFYTLICESHTKNRFKARVGGGGGERCLEGREVVGVRASAQKKVLSCSINLRAAVRFQRRTCVVGLDGCPDAMI